MLLCGEERCTGRNWDCNMFFFLACSIVKEQNRSWRPEAPKIDITPIQIDFAGTYKDGIFQDDDYGLTLPVPPDWTKQIGLAGENKRLVLFPEDQSVLVEFWYFNSILLEPAPREECEWSFVDRGLYHSLNNENIHLVATCFPHQSDNRIVQGYLSHYNKGTWQVEIHSKPEHYQAALEQAEILLKTIEINGVYEWQDLE